MTPTATSSPQSGPSTAPAHPFAHTKNLLVIIPDNGIDVEEESRLYDQLCERPSSPNGPPSIFSNDIYLGDNSGESLAFARDVKISGWTSVGDKLGGAYIVYDCAITTKEGTVIHAHKRYSAFAQLHSTLRRCLPHYQHHFLPTLPPKSPLSKYRPQFIDRRRRLLQYWLASVLLHPEIGGSKPVRMWVMD
ncbi:hypothetical protein PILCRDRAFT_95603 [Piloderma croceum F 1598]|uniref:Endosomal/vacuolar adapter protein YPT35 n=1 Tax=Piloderma croceum (strain F 1598) TaxID=765440 RepID=A0A0C3GCW3_PILCF|nr:hypothetical protein PILCRDRAFT_95603 [Piloderma croceum F 1598]